MLFRSTILQIKLRFDLSHASGHESWFRVSRLYLATPTLIKIKIRFSIFLLTWLRLKVETLSTLISLSLSLINWVFLSVLRSLCSLVSLVISKSLFFILKQTNPFTPLQQNLSSFFTPPGCWLLLLPPHTPPDTAASLCFHFPPWVFSASQTWLPSLRSGKVSSFFIPLFLYFLFVMWVYHFVSAMSVIC